MNKTAFRKAKFGYVSRDRKRLDCHANKDRNFCVDCIVTGNVPFVKKGTEVKVLGRCIETDKLFIFLPAIGWRKVCHEVLTVKQLNLFE